MLGSERERVLKFYFSRLQRNSRVYLIFSRLFLKRLLYYGYVIQYLASYDKEWRINILWFNGWKINQDISFIILNEISYILWRYNNCQSYRLTTCTQCVPIFIKDAVQSVCKQRLCLHFGIQNIEFYSTTIYIFMILEYNKLSRHNNQALQEHKMK
jgi:hypothetical protein